MDGHFTDVVPIIQVRDGMASIDVGNGHKPVIVPIYVLRRFCVEAARKIEAWEAEQAGRVVPHRRRRG